MVFRLVFSLIFYLTVVHVQLNFHLCPPQFYQSFISSKSYHRSCVKTSLYAELFPLRPSVPHLLHVGGRHEGIFTWLRNLSSISFSLHSDDFYSSCASWGHPRSIHVFPGIALTALPLSRTIMLRVPCVPTSPATPAWKTNPVQASAGTKCRWTYAFLQLPLLTLPQQILHVPKPNKRGVTTIIRRCPSLSYKTGEFPTILLPCSAPSDCMLSCPAYNPFMRRGPWEHNEIW